MDISRLIFCTVVFFVFSAIGFGFYHLEEARKSYIPPKDTTNYKSSVFMVDGKELRCVNLGDMRKLSCNWEIWNQ